VQHAQPSDALVVSKRAERYLVPATFITTMGNAFQITAAAILVFRAQRTALAVGWLFIAVAIPQVLLALVFGRVADRFDRRVLCVVADLSSAVIALGLPVWLWLGGAKDIGSYGASFLLACVSALFVPASSALIKERIRDERLGTFNARYEMATNAGMLSASSMAGFLVQFFGPTPLFVANSATFLASAFCSVKLGRRLPRATGASGARAATGAADGGREPSSGPVLRLGILYGSGQVIIVVSNALLTVLILRAFQAGAGFVGVVDALAGSGFILGAAAYGWSAKRISLPKLALAGYLAACVTLVFQPVSLLVLMIDIPISAFVFCQGRIATRTLLMRAAPESRSGRIFGATQAFGLTFAVSATIGLSALSDHSGVKYGFYGMAGVVAASVALVGIPLVVALTRRPMPEPVSAAEAVDAGLDEPDLLEPVLADVATVGSFPAARTDAMDATDPTDVPSGPTIPSRRKELQK
jgi:MFS family permease